MTNRFTALEAAHDEVTLEDLWIYWVKVLRPTRHKIGNFRDFFPANLLA